MSQGEWSQSISRRHREGEKTAHVALKHVRKSAVAQLSYPKETQPIGRIKPVSDVSYFGHSSLDATKRRLICVTFSMSKCSCFTHHLWILTPRTKVFETDPDKVVKHLVLFKYPAGKSSHCDNITLKETLLHVCERTDMDALPCPTTCECV